MSCPVFAFGKVCSFCTMVYDHTFCSHAKTLTCHIQLTEKASTKDTCSLYHYQHQGPLAFAQCYVRRAETVTIITFQSSMAAHGKIELRWRCSAPHLTHLPHLPPLVIVSAVDEDSTDLTHCHDPLRRRQLGVQGVMLQLVGLCLLCTDHAAVHIPCLCHGLGPLCCICFLSLHNASRRQGHNTQTVFDAAEGEAVPSRLET